MAKSCTHRNAGRAPIDNSNSSIFTFAIFYASTSVPTQTSILTEAPTPNQAFAFTPAFASAVGLLGRYTDDDL